MKQALYASVSAMALMLAAHGVAKANDNTATASASAGTAFNTTIGSHVTAPSPVTAPNTIQDNAFQDATGAFQVQQNNSVSSSVSQNMAIGALNDVDDSTDTAIASTVIGVANNATSTSTVSASNNLTNNVFQNAQGAFQVQQGNSIDSTAVQNMAIGAQVAGDIPTPEGVASASTSITVTPPLSATSSSVNGENDISENSFKNAVGAFQVQQDNSINSQTAQTMAIGAQIVEGEDPSAAAATTINVNGLGAAVVSAFGDNTIENDAFRNAQGAFQVQQNNSVNSQTSQNMAIGVQAVEGDTDPAATASSSITVRNIFASGATMTDDFNTIDNRAFENAVGAFQVQQNNSINSQTAQNMAIGAQTASADANSTASASSTFTVGDGAGSSVEAIDATVAALNGIGNDAFRSATGAFQVQQNNSINSQTAQNMAIGSQSLPTDDPGATATTAVNMNNIFADFVLAPVGTGSTVGSTNTIENRAFEDAVGAFQVQQDNSINSATGQNMAIAALTPSDNATSGASLTNNLGLAAPTRVFDGHVLGANQITNDAFRDSAGAFEVQQNNSINSTSQQNMAIGALDTPDGAGFGTSSTVSAATLSSAVAGALSQGVMVAGSNLIKNNAFRNAAGAYQVQQSNSVNSSVGQNMSIAVASVSAH